MKIEVVNFEECDTFIKVEAKKTEMIGFKVASRTALFVMDKMKRLLQPAWVSGRLLTSVHIETSDSRMQGLGASQSSDSGKYPKEDQKFNYNPKDGEAVVGTNVFYAKYADDKSRARGYFEKSQKDGEEYMEKLLNKEAAK